MGLALAPIGPQEIVCLWKSQTARHGTRESALPATGRKMMAKKTELAKYSSGALQPVDAAAGLGSGFLDQDFDEARYGDTNVTGTIYLIHKVGREMRAQGEGRILITGSIAGFMPGSYQAVYNGTKAFLDSFSYALREELKDTGVTVTCLMPGATETEFFRRADMLDTKVGTDKKDDPADVAKDGFRAMMSGEGGVVSGWQNKLEAAAAHVIPSERLAKKHSEMAAPGTAT
jgi:short-subunit dehydrogenase